MKENFHSKKVASFFQSSNYLQRYQLYLNVDYSQLSIDVISSLIKTTLTSESGSDVKRRILKVNNTIRVAGQLNWQIPNKQFVCGLSTLLYDHNSFVGEVNGEPIANCFAICA
ncbi:unnamed protein product [Rotaria sp. Silwood1]|nr:unnamed protein product [Rotaria sp. Silwood1]CAF1274468.1 unnamed protein product [Rotaria sp. Silwood1]CAF3483707.1 unnamed protein product [Rotaria sp. Silwood1]CAF3520151.1 unnamed protein product [Rotaria sp. Silwood1]CAF4957687.1 unnamed protein product [Rotaria sp. Silwood1]